MTNETDDIILDWYVKSVLWWWNYKVELEWMWMEVSAKAAGKMKLYRIKIIPWDKVQLELNEYDPTKWRIIYRYSWKK